uniref:hypothetical protein n=1 Tax=Flavobacterium sp. TaxID=239 RepID=UPI0040493FDD
MQVNKLVDERTGKRTIATSEGCQIDLKDQLNMMFISFTEAVRMYEKEIIQTPPQSRARAFEASLLNSKMIQSIQTNFPINWKFGRYKRFMLNLKGYIVLFKKLNGKNMPMNIKTSHTTSISNQMQTSLFSEGLKSINPILIFGYNKDKLGNIFDPKLVYIDEEKVKWTLTEDLIQTNQVTTHLNALSIEKTLPKLKENLREIKKTSNQ